MIETQNRKNSLQIKAEIGKNEDKCQIANPIICNKCQNYFFNPFNSMMDCKKHYDYFPLIRVKLEEGSKK